jgi:hypothetical protein
MFSLFALVTSLGFLLLTRIMVSTIIHLALLFSFQGPVFFAGFFITTGKSLLYHFSFFQSTGIFNHQLTFIPRRSLSPAFSPAFAAGSYNFIILALPGQPVVSSTSCSPLSRRQPARPCL